jgi:hypothetical protein
MKKCLMAVAALSVISLLAFAQGRVAGKWMGEQQGRGGAQPVTLERRLRDILLRSRPPLLGEKGKIAELCVGQYSFQRSVFGWRLLQVIHDEGFEGRFYWLEPQAHLLNGLKDGGVGRIGPSRGQCGRIKTSCLRSTPRATARNLSASSWPTRPGTLARRRETGPAHHVLHHSKDGIHWQIHHDFVCVFKPGPVDHWLIEKGAQSVCKALHRQFVEFETHTAVAAWRYASAAGDDRARALYPLWQPRPERRRPGSVREGKCLQEPGQCHCPCPEQPPRVERMNVLLASVGGVDALLQKFSQIPSSRRYCSTFET